MSGLLRRLRPRSRQDRPASREYSQPNDHTGQPVATSFRPAPIRFRSPGPVAVEPPAPASQLETRRGSQRACRSRCPEPTATLLPEPPAPVGPPTSSPAFPSNLRLSFTAQNGSPYPAPVSRSPKLLNQAVGTGTSTVGSDCSLGRPTSICCCLWVGNEDEMQSLWCGTTTQSGSTSQPNEPANANLPTLGGKSEAFDDLDTGQRGEHSTR